MNYNGYGYQGPYTYGQTSPFMTQTYTPTASQQADLFTYPQNLQNALELILQALSGETEDRMFYSWLIEQAPSKEDQTIIAGIRDDEIGHYSLFRQLYYELTGLVPQQTQGEQFTPPQSYCDGLARALQGEQNAVRKYRHILYAMQYPVHINIMTEIITDEIRHGILYSYLYSKNSCTA